MNEYWKDVIEFEGTVQISNLGRIRSTKRTVTYLNGRVQTYPEKILHTRFNKAGYEYITITRQGKQHTRYIHSLVLETFVGPRPENYICRHFPDNSKLNNKLSNLQWGTHNENMVDRDIHGNTAKGIRHGMSKLTSEDVEIIKSSKKLQKELASEFGVCQGTISAILTNRSWA